MWIITFRELYTMCIPLYVPSFDWLLDVAFSYYQRWSWKEGMPYGERIPGIDSDSGDVWPHPYSPFKLDTLEARSYWLKYTDYGWEGVFHFRSIPELLYLACCGDHESAKRIMF